MTILSRVRRGAFLALVITGACAQPLKAAAVNAFDAMSPSGTSRGGPANISEDDARKLALAMHDALCTADKLIVPPPAGSPLPGGTPPAGVTPTLATPATPAASAPTAPVCNPETAVPTASPDANYVSTLAAALEANLRVAYGLTSTQDIPEPAQDYLLVYNLALAKSPLFDANVRKLYVEQMRTLRRIYAPSPKDGSATRIVGGSPIPLANDAVYITDVMEGAALNAPCSGTLITPPPAAGSHDSGSLILTAAHCVCTWAKGKPISLIRASVRVGQDAVSDNSFKAYPVRSIVIKGVCPPSAASADIFAATAGTDLALVTTSEAVTPEFAKPRAILSPAGYAGWKSGANNYFVRVGGYACRSIGCDVSEIGVRNFADAHVVTFDCSTPADFTMDCSGSSEFVTSGPATPVVPNGVNDLSKVPSDQIERFGTCYGDSGGPVYASTSPDNTFDRFYLIGVIRGGTGCGGYSLHSLAVTPQAVCWIRQQTHQRAQFVKFDGTPDTSLPPCP